MPSNPDTFQFDASPNEEAVKLIAQKAPIVSKEVFSRLLPELRGRAFLVSDVECANTLQAVRDRIADLPAGGDWTEIKRDIFKEISPHLIDPTADQDEQARQRLASDRRAELLLRMHGFEAYQAASYQVQERQKDVFPYRQYLTMGDDRVRDSHAVLNNVVLPVDHPFWQNHYPPWDYGCRCSCVAISQSDYEDVQAEDAKRKPEDRQIIEGAQLRKLEENGTLFRSVVPGEPAKPVDVRAPVDKATTAQERNAAFQWHPGHLTLGVDQLRARYDKPVFDAFEAFARKQLIDQSGTTVWDWIGGKRVLPAQTPMPKPAAPEGFSDKLAKLGLDKLNTWAAKDVRALMRSLRRPDAPKAKSIISAITGADTKGKFSEKSVMAMAQEFMNFIPGAVAQSLPPFEIQIVQSLGSPNKVGQYDPTAQVLTIAKGSPFYKKAADLRETIYHELTHWVHLHGPQSYRDAIKALYDQRTTGERALHFPGYTHPLRRDKWWIPYAGTQYPGETDASVLGVEVPTCHTELFARPDRMAQLISSNPDAKVIENLAVIMGVFSK